MPEPPSYACRSFAKVRRETSKFTQHKLLTGMCLAITTLIVRLTLWHFHRITLTWDEVWSTLLTVIASFAIVALGALIVNLFRAPALLDQERASEITLLKRDNEAKVAETALLKLKISSPPNEPIVCPDGYVQHEKQGYGLLVANDGYAANTISIPDVVIGHTLSRLSFKGMKTRLAPHEKHFFEACIKHPDRPEREGGQLRKQMVSARIDELKVGIVYQGTDFRAFRSNCVIKRYPGQVGLDVFFVGRELIDALPS